MTEQQCTLARPVQITGVGLFLGQPVRLQCLPAPAGSGVVFVRVDLPGRPRIPVSIENVQGPQRWTALGQGDTEVRMVEHVLAALYGLAIDNLVIETTAAEMPVGDGSARTFTVPFLDAGIKPLGTPRKTISLRAPLGVTDNDVALLALPQADSLDITYILDYGRHFLRCQTLTIKCNRETFLQEIAPARTYVLRPEVDAFIKVGLGRGATPENTLILEEDGRMSSPPRFPDECARHKILDMLGDLYLAGSSISARIIGYKSGHSTNVRLAKAIAEAGAANP